MAVAGGSGVALAEREIADEGFALFVQREFQVHAFRIIGAAGKAVVLLEFDGGRFVAVDLSGHVAEI